MKSFLSKPCHKVILSDITKNKFKEIDQWFNAIDQDFWFIIIDPVINPNTFDMEFKHLGSKVEFMIPCERTFLLFCLKFNNH